MNRHLLGLLTSVALHSAFPCPDSADVTSPAIEGQQAAKPDAPEESPPADRGIISFDAEEVDWRPYAKKITKIIQKRWVKKMPRAARDGHRGRTVIKFRIAMDGTVSHASVKESCGNRGLDEHAKNAIEGSSPLPDLPSGFEKLDREHVGVTFEFYYNMDPPSRSGNAP